MIGILLGVVIAGAALYYFYPGEKLPAGSSIDRIEVWKSKRRLQVFSQGRLLKTYRISLGKVPIGAKQFEGDNKTPEGTYYINGRNPNSGYHKNLGISYPNTSDMEFARAHNKPVGGDVKIHGLRNGSGIIGKFHRWKNWTAGCIAVTDAEMDELYAAVTNKAEITIHP